MEAVVERVRILIASGNGLTRIQLRDGLLPFGEKVEVVALAPNGAEALLQTSTASPEVVVTAATLPDMDGLAFSRSVRQQFPMVSVVVLSDAPQDEELFEAIRFGAAAYLSTDTPPEEMVDVVTRVRAGAYVIDEHVLANPSLALRILGAFRELTAIEERVKPLFVPLSPRELEVLENAGQGSSNRAIAKTLSISEQTVKNHLGSIMRKLAVNDRTHAVVYALQQGWISIPDL
ncbi:MAG: DNA-binding response regulator [Chloroflexi bacterium]|nr:MAG: DNA-binding response regulator [Chloroflexota bacterium]